jgi:hypothetical protein
MGDVMKRHLFQRKAVIRRYFLLTPVVFAVLAFIACDTGTNSGPVNLLIGTWKRETDTAVYEITFTDTEYIYKAAYNQEGGHENIITTNEYISNGSLFSIFTTISIYNDNNYVVMKNTYYYYIKDDRLLISNFNNYGGFYEFFEYKKTR